MPKAIIYTEYKQPPLFGEGQRADRIREQLKRSNEYRARKKAKEEARREGPRATGAPHRIKAYKER
jgi:hypothetical protein